MTDALTVVISGDHAAVYSGGGSPTLHKYPNQPDSSRVRRTSVPLGDIRVHPALLGIRGVNKVLVRKLAGSLDVGRLRIVLAYCPGSSELHQAIIDGHSRYAAAIDAGLAAVQVEWVDVATAADARLEAARRNCSHGVGYPRALRRVLAVQFHADFPDKSQEWIAKQVNCCQKSVSNWLSAARFSENNVESGVGKYSEIRQLLKAAMSNLDKITRRTEKHRLRAAAKCAESALEKLKQARDRL